ncbi:hypothetical protein BGW36DRAFT_364773 [Talaromyces proteolyticus]|uniref:MACPF domain-containing protein n=1 Tax=Talaromyces proteolyticus TaxID=1131652 RepID=A0AAD4PV00_9EURO|nr:uncharacterized protein BGW36DRAFT_364773 [Talaromyces proteolyticus]KAH8690041.1 hypothetical protein BGW36DRAFT_364773 [Talaromyces proteolyticus]
MATPILPACSVLGTSVNLAQQDIMPNSSIVACIDASDHHAVRNSSSKAIIVTMGVEGEIITTPGSTKQYRLPENVRLIDSGGRSEANDIICEMGKEMAERLSVSASASAGYMGVSATVSSQYSYETTFKSTSLYAIYSFDQQVYSVLLRDPWHSYIDERLIDHANSLPEWRQDTGTYEAFETFFYRWGTHLKLEQEEASSEIKESFALHAKVEYKSIMSSEVGYENESEYREYLKKRMTQCAVLGGAFDKAGKLAKDPTNNTLFVEWQESRSSGATDDLTNLRVDSLGTFLMNSPNDVHKNVGRRLTPALDYFTQICTLKGVLYCGPPLDISKPVPTWFECEITPLPGLKITIGNTQGWTTRQLSPTHVRVDRAGSTSPHCQVDITIVAPIKPVNVIFRGDWGDKMMLLSYFNVSTGSESRSGYHTVVSLLRGSEGTIHVPSLKHWGSFLPSTLSLAEQSSMTREYERLFSKEVREGT